MTYSVPLQWRLTSVPGAEGPLIDSSVTETEARTLQEYARDKLVLEIGSAYGYSTVVMGLVAKQVVAVDPHQWLPSLDVMKQNLAAYGVSDRVAIWQLSSEAAYQGLSGTLFDLVFIDGDHSASAVRHDLAMAQRLLAPGRVVCCHDYLTPDCPGVRQACDEWRVPDRIVDSMAVYET